MAAVWRCASRTTGPSSYPSWLLIVMVSLKCRHRLRYAGRGPQAKQGLLYRSYYRPVAGRILHGAFRVGEKIITYSLTLFLILCTVVITVFTRWCGKHSNRVKTNFSSGISMPMEKPVSGQCYGKDDVYLDGRQWVPYRL